VTDDSPGKPVGARLEGPCYSQFRPNSPRAITRVISEKGLLERAFSFFFKTVSSLSRRIDVVASCTRVDGNINVYA